MSANHSKRGAARAPIVRRTTKGPLDDDADDPVSTSQSPTVSSVDPSPSPLLASSELDESLTVPLASSQAPPDVEPLLLSTTGSHDLSFLLDASIYHPVSYIDTPLPFRHELPAAPPAGTPLNQIFSDLARVLKQCHFLPAAHLAATCLTTGLVQATDTISIFRLLSVRYSALELSGNVLLAAQESKALEDLSSTFYYSEPTRSTDAEGASETQQHEPRHIMPFDLRLQALRLQGIGFGDARRAVGALFDLGMECRDNLAKAGTDSSSRSIWTTRLEEVGIRVVNALIDMGDLDCAKRTLRSMKPKNEDKSLLWLTRMVLLLIKMGELHEARELSKRSDLEPVKQTILMSFLEAAEGNAEEATKMLSRAIEDDADPTMVAIARQNLAVAYLYTGKIEMSREILEQLVDDGYSFQALTVNLATLYDLTSDRSRDLKVGLATKIANMRSMQPRRGIVNADFKL